MVIETTTRPRILLAVPPGLARQLWQTRLEALEWEVFMLDRERVVPDHRVVIEDSEIFVDAAPVSPRARALILDSGYLWHVPTLAPDEETWRSYRHRFDDLLRNERETLSFWYSLLEILNDRLPGCINRQTAFAHEALKPAALQLLEDTGVPVAPFLVSNDVRSLEALFETSERVLEHDLLLQRRVRATARSSLRGRLEASGVLFLQGIDDAPLSRLWAVGSQVVHLEVRTPHDNLRTGDGQAADQDITAKEARDVEAWGAQHLGPVMTGLDLEFAVLTLARHGGALALADFSPAPDIATLPPQAVERVVEAVVHRLEEMGP